MFTLNADAKFGQHGQFIAQIMGRDQKFTFNYSFVGRKCGKRNESTSFDVDTSGIFVERDVDSKGRKIDRFYTFLDCPHLPIPEGKSDTLRKLEVTKEDAMKIGKALDEGRSFEESIEFYREDYMKSQPRKYNEETGAYDDQPQITASRNNYRILSKKDAVKAQTGQTLDTAVAECLRILEALPTELQRKAVQALTKATKPVKEVVEVV